MTDKHIIFVSNDCRHSPKSLFCAYPLHGRRGDYNGCKMLMAGFGTGMKAKRMPEIFNISILDLNRRQVPINAVLVSSEFGETSQKSASRKCIAARMQQLQHLLEPV